ncbi:MAG: LysR family transcriptional regulator [Firmicutes bacterium]|nr:LysR family transcriptional regulator [Bacillota bacterium]
MPINNNTNFNLYRSFLAVYETKSVRGASEITNTTHSAVSQNLKELGKQLGITLFNPLPRGMEPTSDAITLYPVIKAAVDMIYAGEVNVRVFTPETPAVIRLSAPSTLVSYTLIDYFVEFKKKYPYVTFEFHGRGGVELLNLHRIDFVIDLDHYFKGYKFKITPLYSEKCTFIASKKFLAEHNLSETITLEQLSTLPVVGHHEFLRTLQNENDIKLNIFATTATSEKTIAFTNHAIGLGYYFDSTLSAVENKDIVPIKIKDLQNPTFNSVLAYNEATITKPAQAFIEGLIEFCAKLN